MRFGVLGPLHVVADSGARLDPRAGRQRRLLLALLTWRDAPVSLDRLVDAVWTGDEPLPRDPAATIRTYLTRLRHALEPDGVGGTPTLLVGGPDRYGLRLDGHELDADAFEADLAAARDLVDEQPDEALRFVERGLARWTGAALEEVADEDWARPEAVRLDELRIVAEELRLRCLLDTGRHLEALPELERRVREHPLREQAHGQLLQALHRAGRTAEATARYRSFRERLADETGLDPSPELDALHTRLLRGDDAPPSRALPATAGHDAGPRSPFDRLPTPRTPLVGREDQVGVVTQLCATARVVTLAGVGGVGKTRLALEVAHEVRRTGRRVAFVDVGVVTEADEVVDAVGSALYLPAPARQDQVDGLVRLLGTEPTLLVLDNCEHVVDAVSRLIEELTAWTSELTVLATSREVLGVDGEHAHRVPSLSPDAGVELFLARAAAAVPAHDPGLADRGAIEEVCRRLDGIPLAIELAAARTSHLTVAQIADRLDERFWLLAGGRRARSRHQTLQAAMDWSYELLEDDGRALLRAASVFTGPFDAGALAAVAGGDEQPVLDQLGVLVTSSLVEPYDAGSDVRYRLLETVRLHAHDRLVELGEAATRHAAHATHVLERALAHPPHVHDVGVWGQATYEDDLSNQLAALEWFDRHDDRASLGQLAARLPTVLGYTGYVDTTRRYLERQDVADAVPDGAERALYLAASAGNASYLGDFDQQYVQAEAALRAATDPATRGLAAAHLANACLVVDPERVPDVVAEALPTVPEHARNIRLSLRSQEPLGLVVLGRYADAVPLLEALVQEGQGFAAAELSLLHHVLGRDELALAVPRPGAVEPDHRLWDYRWALARALVAASRGASEEAAANLIEAGERVRASPIGLLDRDVLIGAAALELHRGDVRRASELLARSREGWRTPSTAALYRHYRDLLRARLPADQRAAIIEQHTGGDVRRVLDEELARLGAELGSPPAAAS